MIKPPFDLKCEYLYDPIGIDVILPRFSWILNHDERNQNQSAFQIIVSSNKEHSELENGDLWNSGKVREDNTVNISYKGEPLKSNNQYFWRVKWWDNDDNESGFSEIAKFETAFLFDNEWIAKWITKLDFIDKKKKKDFQYISGIYTITGRIKEYFAVYLRKEFTLTKKVQNVKIYICGLGYYELRINGRKIGNSFLDPAWTDYAKRALYSTYEITDIIKDKNAIGVILGNGRCLEKYGYDYPKLILQVIIQYDDNTKDIISSDDTWKASGGPILENGIYYGEKYDARLEMDGWDNPNFDNSSWKSVVIVKGPRLESQLMQPIRYTDIIKPKKLYSTDSGVYIYDFGQDFAGIVKLKVYGPKGSEVKIRYSEIIHNDGNLNTATNRVSLATDIYILKGFEEEIFEPHFTYHGFRYVEISGFPGVPTLENIEGIFIHTDVPKIGKFFCSNNLINQIHENIIWGQLSNFMSIPTDCPQRDERQGWMGDAQLTIEEAIFNFNIAQFYTKYIRDIQLCQKETGSVSDVVPPYWPFYPADPAWGTAYITIAWYLYLYYNDIKIFKDNYDNLKKYIDFLDKNAQDNILYKFGKYGDWCPPGNIVSRKTPIEHVNTWYYYHDTYILSKIAQILGNNQDHNELLNRSEKIKEAYNKKFLVDAYIIPKLAISDSTVSQTSNILPLYLNMVPEKNKNKVISTLINCIIEDYDYHMDTGIVGTRYLWDVLTDNGYPEIAYKIITQESYPGYGYMIKEGATTLWERWEKLEGNGMNSHNHIMLGSVDTWFYKSLVGINLLEPCWKKIKIKPFIPKDMNYATASIYTIKGLLYCSWEKKNKSLKLIINIPVGSICETWIPIEDFNCEIKEGNISIWKNGSITEVINGIKYKELKNNFIIFDIGSGYYQFYIEYKK